MPSFASKQQRTLIDAIFHEQDQEIRAAFQRRTEKLARREQLSQVSGIRDEAVLDRLIELEIGPEALVALELVPLVFVAWADGAVQADERQNIVAAAKAAGIPQQDNRYPLLEHWLKRRPGKPMLEAWEHYVKALCERLSKEEIEKLRQVTLMRARAVAQASGGILGFGSKVSATEKSVLERLEAAFA